MSIKEANKFVCVSARFIQNEKAGVTVAFCRFAHMNGDGKPSGVCLGSKGIARCAPEDVFDAETGKRIAVAKAERKILTEFLADKDQELDYIDAAKARADILSQTILAEKARMSSAYVAAAASLSACEEELKKRKNEA